MPEKHTLLSQHAMLCGLILLNLNMRMQSVGQQLVTQWYDVQQLAFLHNLAPALKPGARVGIVDLDRATWLHGTPRDLLTCELSAVGYRQVGFHALAGDLGYLAVFEAPADGARPKPSEIEPCRLQKP